MPAGDSKEGQEGEHDGSGEDGYGYQRIMADVGEPLVFRGIRRKDGPFFAFDELEVAFRFREVRGELQGAAVVECGQAGFVEAVVGVTGAKAGVGAGRFGEVRIFALFIEVVNGFCVFALFIGPDACFIRFSGMSGHCGEGGGQNGAEQQQGKLGDGFFYGLQYVLAFRMGQFVRGAGRLEGSVVPEL